MPAMNPALPVYRRAKSFPPYLMKAFIMPQNQAFTVFKGSTTNLSLEDVPKPLILVNRQRRLLPPNLARFCWDITYLPSTVRGQFYYLYMIEDVYSRKIVGFEVYDREAGDLAAKLLERTLLKRESHWDRGDTAFG